MQAALGDVPEVWWYTQPAAPNCAVSQHIGKSEPKSAFRARARARLPRWERPSPRVAAPPSE